MKIKRYIGMKKPLRGKTALVRDSSMKGVVLAQFDDRLLTYRGLTLGFDWHPFKVEEFEELEP